MFIAANNENKNKAMGTMHKNKANNIENAIKQQQQQQQKHSIKIPESKRQDQKSISKKQLHQTYKQISGFLLRKKKRNTKC